MAGNIPAIFFALNLQARFYHKNKTSHDLP